MKWRGLGLNLLVMFLMFAAAAGAAIPNITGFNTRADGYTVTAAVWNAELGGIYSYINANLVAALNTLTTKGDIFSHNGTALTRVGVGTNGQVLTAASGETSGVKWESVASVATLTTKGDLLSHNGTNNVRLGVGTNGQVLTAASGETSGLAWSTAAAVPTGVIALWSGSFATIPTGWHLCDGTTGTPDLQGFFILAAGNVSAGTNGPYGLISPGAQAGATKGSHSHAKGTLATSASTDSTVNVEDGTNAPIRPNNHTHGVTGSTASQDVTPGYYALAYIQKLFLWLFPARRRRRLCCP